MIKIFLVPRLSVAIATLSFPVLMLQAQGFDPGASATAASITFQKTYYAEGFDQGYDVAVLSDGYVICGSTERNDFDADGVLIRTDLQGNILWQKSFGGAGYDQFEKVIAGNDGGIVTCGTFVNPTSMHTEFCMMKVNESTGELIWQKNWGGNFDAFARGDIIPVHDGYLVSTFHIDFNGSFAAYSQFIRLDNVGNILWSSEAYTSFDDMSTDFSIHAVTDTAFYACGRSALPGKIFNIIPDSGAVKLVWEYEDVNQAHPSDLCLLSDGNLLMCGRVSAGINGSTNDKIFLHKSTPVGLPIWSKTLDLPGSALSLPSMSTTSDGHLMLTAGNDYEYKLLAKIDIDGHVLWAKSFGGSQTRSFSQAHQTPDGGFVFAGYIQNGVDQKFDILLVKTDADGNIETCTSDNRDIAVSNYNLARSPTSLLYGDYWSYPAKDSIAETHLTGLSQATYCEYPLLLWYADTDQDGFGNSGASQYAALQPPGYVPVGGDCDDNNANVFPGATELANGIDDNCNGQIDEDVVAVLDAGLDQLQLFPNPVQDILTVSWANNGAVSNYQLFDLSGKMLNEVRLSSGLKQITVSVSDLPKGLYRISLLMENGQTKSCRFVKL